MMNFVVCVIISCCQCLYENGKSMRIIFDGRFNKYACCNECYDETYEKSKKLIDREIELKPTIKQDIMIRNKWLLKNIDIDKFSKTLIHVEKEYS